MLDIVPLFVGGMPGGMELAVILLIAVLLFGANKIPKLAKSTGQAMGEFQKGREEVEQELENIREGGQTSDSETGSTETGTETETETQTETESTSDSKTTKE
ncbi:MAG: twin-arginine translocase TatA/TatE family subunit [Halodesulfurarchaeum sp.]